MNTRNSYSERERAGCEKNIRDVNKLEPRQVMELAIIGKNLLFSKHVFIEWLFL